MKKYEHDGRGADVLKKEREWSFIFFLSYYSDPGQDPSITRLRD